MLSRLLFQLNEKKCVLESLTVDHFGNHASPTIFASLVAESK